MTKKTMFDFLAENDPEMQNFKFADIARSSLALFTAENIDDPALAWQWTLECEEIADALSHIDSPLIKEAKMMFPALHDAVTRQDAAAIIAAASTLRKMITKFISKSGGNPNFAYAAA